VKSRISSFALCLVGVVSLVAPAGAEAAVVTIGNTAAAVGGGSNAEPLMFINSSLGSVGGNATSPIDGEIIRWRVNGFQGPWRLRVVTPNGGLNYTGSGTSATENVADLSAHTFSTSLPVKAGQTIGIESTGPGTFGAVSAPGGTYAIFFPPLADGATGDAISSSSEVNFTFSADVLPAPTIAGAFPASGSVAGGAAVAIPGSDFVDVRAVSFGGVPATSFSALNEGVVTAVAPRSKVIGPVPITVTTVAGTATSPQPFTYKGCKVPKLKDRKLKAAKKRIRKAGCAIGKVRLLDGATAKTGSVLKQSPKPGKVLPPGTKVNVKLG